MQKQLPMAAPQLGNDELQAIEAVVKSGQLAQGEVVAEFENQFAEYIGAENAVAVINGTVALDLALKALGIKQGDAVLTTAFSFIATANCILYQNARPVFVDVDERTFNMDPNDAASKVTPKTKAILGVHLFGHPFDVTAIQEVSEDHKLILVEDCAQAHGATFRGEKVGSFGVGCFSFYPTKNITTGEGGMVTTNDEQVMKRLRLLRDHGQTSKYTHSLLGYNYRMTEIQAALGRVQLGRLDTFNRTRRRNAAYLSKHLHLDGLVTPFALNGVIHVYNQYVVTLNHDKIEREAFVRYLRSNGISSAIHYPMPIFRQPIYSDLGYTDENVQCPTALKLADCVLSLPVHPGLRIDDMEYICKVVNGYLASS
jgi:perosamine synthetase